MMGTNRYEGDDYEVKEIQQNSIIDSAIVKISEGASQDNCEEAEFAYIGTNE